MLCCPLQVCNLISQHLSELTNTLPCWTWIPSNKIIPSYFTKHETCHFEYNCATKYVVLPQSYKHRICLQSRYPHIMTCQFDILTLERQSAPQLMTWWSVSPGLGVGMTKLVMTSAARSMLCGVQMCG